VLAIEDRFGSSAPLKVLMENYGFTAANVAAKAVECRGPAGTPRGAGPEKGLSETRAKSMAASRPDPPIS